MLTHKKRQICLVCGTYWKTCYCTQKARRNAYLDQETNEREVMNNVPKTENVSQ